MPHIQLNLLMVTEGLAVVALAVVRGVVLGVVLVVLWGVESDGA